MVATVLSLFSNVKNGAAVYALIEKLSEPMGRLLENEEMWKIRGFGSKLEQCWQKICSSLRTKYGGPGDDRLLAILTPLFLATFEHQKRSVVKEAIQLWQEMFAKASRLEYPDRLRVLVVKVKDKHRLTCPSLTVPISGHSETPQSEGTFPAISDSLENPSVPGSPRKRFGSMLNPNSPNKVPASLKRLVTEVTEEQRPDGPSSDQSPAKAVRTRSQKRKLLLDEMDSQDFVFIPPTPKQKRRILTDHQKDVLTERREMPFLDRQSSSSQSGNNLLAFFGTASQDSQD